MPSLLDVLQSLDDQPAEAAIFAARPWTAISDAAVGVLDEPPHGLTYLLEVELAEDVLEVWSSWRDGAEPNVQQKCQAVIHYAEHDAYLDVHR
ncbi:MULTISPECIES: hypothetical protein [unclassified Streptomyces]|uniref:hypothetical protein n=1 Tax=unclassified Streptomyces TaxID=2593676 RepID=UPI002E81E06B|nr:hypothetical protein [Streptomyces sp. NBC_00589]WTI42076.1 hypothetical protein OIC96_47560 [Streptomyces sp. NBC_00775]WUB24242.1 hypothetical protein OHA51_02155 [Streptomyces sp. NBC_00589]